MKVLQILVDPETAKKVVAIAKRKGLSQSGYVRSLILQDLSRRKPIGDLPKYEAMEFYDDMHSHHYEHARGIYPTCKMCELLFRFKYYSEVPKEWNPPRKDGRPDNDRIDEYIKGLQS